MKDVHYCHDINSDGSAVAFVTPIDPNNKMRTQVKVRYLFIEY